MVRQEPTHITVRRFVACFGGALTVVIANVVVVIHVAKEATTSRLPNSAIALQQPLDTVAPIRTTDPPTKMESPASALATPATTIDPVMIGSLGMPTPTPAPWANVVPSPGFLDVCGSATYDETACVAVVLAAINDARALESLPPMILPTNWTGLSAPEQLFVATNLERTARGMVPLSAMTAPLDAAAAQAAAAETDPQPPVGFPWTQFGGNWAGGVLRSPLEALYYWMYDDGLGSSNIDCSSSDPAGCWGHRRALLLPLTCTPCVVGAAWTTTSEQTTSTAELIVNARRSSTVDFEWAQEEPYLHE